jgi:hypothetical protein
MRLIEELAEIHRYASTNAVEVAGTDTDTDTDTNTDKKIYRSSLTHTQFTNGQYNRISSAKLLERCA